jgi:(1->4)-alpha-D-glucan 1-alpha-D-glucosylmutase
LIAAGAVEGLRIDHPDGLYDPLQYLQRLQTRVASLIGGDPAATDQASRPIYLIIEKISAGHERALESWPVHGTTGYRFANVVSGLFVDTTARDKMDRIYRAFVANVAPYEDVVYSSKALILRTALASELNVLSSQLARIARADRNTRDYTLNSLRRALTEVVACFPVYRTYITERPRAADRRYIQWAVAAALRRSRAADITVFDFVQTVLLGSASVAGLAPAEESLAFARKFQQLTAPVNAKGLEDTAFYRYNRLVSLNEVGGDPREFGFTLSAFHGASHDRATHWPHTLLATSTHDSKRAEDSPAHRCLSELPAAWRLAVRRWSRINRSKKIKLEDGPAPSFNDEYLLYQTLIGTWPLEPLDDARLATYRARIQAYMGKAVREAKVQSSWVNVNAQYETAVTTSLVRRWASRREPVSRRLRGRVGLIAWLGMLWPADAHQANIAGSTGHLPRAGCGISRWSIQTIDGRWTSTGAARCWMRSRRWRTPPMRVAAVRSDARRLDDGRAKLLVIHAALRSRRTHGEVFQQGAYVPLSADAPHDQRIIAFARRFEKHGVIVVAPRLLARLVEQPGMLPLGAPTWGETRLALPWLAPEARLEDLLTGRSLSIEKDERGAVLALAEVLRDFPVGLLFFTTPADGS